MQMPREGEFQICLFHPKIRTIIQESKGMDDKLMYIFTFIFSNSNLKWDEVDFFPILPYLLLEASRGVSASSYNKVTISLSVPKDLANR